MRIMAVASGGGHWVELRRIVPAFDGAEVVYVSTDPQADADLAPARYYAVRNVTRKDRLAFAATIRQLSASEQWQGRINATFRVLGFGGSLIGTLLGGVFGEWIGLRPVLVSSAAIIALGSLWARGITTTDLQMVDPES